MAELSAVRLNLFQPSNPIGAIYPVEEVIVYKRSKYQEIMIVKLRGFGKTLVLDGLIQSTERDEYIYHESLVHPAMILHPNPKRVLILGGGEGATLREVLKHNTVEEAVMVDIDEDVVDLAKKYLREWHQGAFDDPRSKVVIMDGFEYIKHARDKGEVYDVIIMDLTDPYGSEVAAKLYTVEAMKLVKSVMNEDSILVVQAGSSTFFYDAFRNVYESLRAVFRIVEEYGSWIPSFMYVNSFLLASDKYSMRSLSMNEVDERLKARGVKTKFYNGLRHYTFIGLAGITLAES